MEPRKGTAGKKAAERRDPVGSGLSPFYTELRRTQHHPLFCIRLNFSTSKVTMRGRKTRAKKTVPQPAAPKRVKAHTRNLSPTPTIALLRHYARLALALESASGRRPTLLTLQRRAL